MEKKFYEVPTQVKFWETDSESYIGGIAYRDEIICGCCGGIFEIQDICRFAPEGVEPIIAYDDWVNIAEEIIGE